jgi:uncharacterized membrane protein YvbJ
MVYCPKCGTQNPDGSRYCANCGAPLMGERWDKDKEIDKKCEETCSGRGPAGKVLWAIIIILIGFWLVFEFGLKNIEGLPDWVYNFSFWWIIPVVVGLAVIIWGVSILVKR